MSDTDTAVQEAPKQTRELSVEQKEAASLRRDATLLRKYGNDAKADELEAKADKLFPQSKHQGKRVNFLSVSSSDDQKALKDYFRTAKGFERLCDVVSAKKLQEIVEELSV